MRADRRCLRFAHAELIFRRVQKRAVQFYVSHLGILDDVRDDKLRADRVHRLNLAEGVEGRDLARLPSRGPGVSV